MSFYDLTFGDITRLYFVGGHIWKGKKCSEMSVSDIKRFTVVIMSCLKNTAPLSNNTLASP